MAQNIYKGMVSLKSRRLRTVGFVLLAAILAMTVYGGAVLMPSLRKEGATLSRRSAEPTAGPGTAATHVPTERERKVLTTKILFAYGYWASCGTLLIALLFIAYLDFREVTRTYLGARRAIWNEIAQRGPDERET